MTSLDERDRQVRQVVEAFVKAVMAEDFDAYRRLHADDVQGELDPALFARNVDKAKRHRYRFQLTEIVHEGEVAEARVEVVPQDGDEGQRDELTLVLTLEPDGFRIVES